MVELQHRRHARGHADRVGRECSGVREHVAGRLRVEHIHDFGAAGDGANGKSTADDLAQRGHVGRDAVARLQAGVLGPERDDFIEHQQHPVARGPLAQRGNELDIRRTQADAVRHQVDQYAREVLGVLVQDRQRALGIVERKDNDVLERGLGCPVHQRNAARMVDAAPGRRRGALAHLGVVVDAVVGALGLGDLRPPGKCAGRLQRDHDRLRARVHEAHLLERAVAAAQVLGIAHLDLGSHHERGAAGHLLRHRLDDLGAGVAVDEGRHVVGEVDARDALEVGHAAALAALDVGRATRPQDRVAADAAGKDFEGPLVEGGAA